MTRRCLSSSQLRIDLDQQKINTYLDEGAQTSFDHAKSVYEKGGYSKSMATLKFSGNGFPEELKKGDVVVGKSTEDTDVVLMAADTVSAGATSAKFQYKEGNCNVGGLPGPSDGADGSGEQNWSGCTLHLTTCRGRQLGASRATGLKCRYPHRLTLSPFSVTLRPQWHRNAEGGRDLDLCHLRIRRGDRQHERPHYPILQHGRERKNETLRRSGFYPEFQKYYNYYGDADYGDKWVQAAFTASATDFSSGKGNADFSSYDLDARLRTYACSFIVLFERISWVVVDPRSHFWRVLISRSQRPSKRALCT